MGLMAQIGGFSEIGRLTEPGLIILHTVLALHLKLSDEAKSIYNHERTD